MVTTEKFTSCHHVFAVYLTFVIRDSPAWPIYIPGWREALLIRVILVYTTPVNITFRTHWLASSEVISQVLWVRYNFLAWPFVGILSQIKLLCGQLVFQLVWYIIKQINLFTLVSVKVVDMLWFKFTSNSNFYKPVHIFQTGSYFSNQFIFFKLVHIYQTGSYFSNWFIFFKLGWNF